MLFYKRRLLCYSEKRGYAWVEIKVRVPDPLGLLYDLIIG